MKGKTVSVLSVISLLVATHDSIKIFAMSRSCLYPKCPSCNNYLDPTCASNGLTYPNECWIECYNELMECDQKIEIASKGWCPIANRSRGRSTLPSVTTQQSSSSSSSSPEQICNISACNCRSAYNPICGSDGVTYSNTCYYRCARRCFIDLEFVKCGLCSWTYPPNRLCLGRTII